MITFSISYLSIAIVGCIIFSLIICYLIYRYIRIEKEYNILLNKYERLIKKNEKLQNKITGMPEDISHQDKKENIKSIVKS